MSIKSLPKTWYITVTEENCSVLREWRFGKYHFILKPGYIVGMYDWGHCITKEYDTSANILLIRNYGIEISYDDFKYHVLGEKYNDYDVY